MTENDFSFTRLHPRAVEGLRHYNAGRYFEAHEELEAAWRAESGPIRELYQGILQVGVARYHLERGNTSGAIKVVRRGIERLALFPERVLGIDIAQVLEDARRMETYLAAGDWSKSPPRLRPIKIPEIKDPPNG